MTIQKNGDALCCSADCNLCGVVEMSQGGVLDGVYTCINPTSTHYAHVFTDDHPICDDPCLRKED